MCQVYTRHYKLTCLMLFPAESHLRHQDMFGPEVEVVDQGHKFDDGAYFQIGSDGKATLKEGAKTIDMSKLSKDDLKKMGIDPDTMSKEQIARQLKVLVTSCRRDAVLSSSCQLITHTLMTWTRLQLLCVEMLPCMRVDCRASHYFSLI